jgi:hypothetical protein
MLVWMGLILGVYAAVILLGMFWPFEGVGLLTYPVADSPTMMFQIFVLTLRIALYASVLPILLGLVAILRKRKLGLILAGIYFIAINVAALLFQMLLEDGLMFSKGVLLGNLLFCFLFLTRAFTRRIARDEDEEDDTKEPLTFDKTATSRWMLVLDVASLVIFISLFFVPLYIRVRSGGTSPAILINTLFTGDTDLIVVVGFFVLLLILFIALMMLMSLFTVYSTGDLRFLKQSKRFIKFLFITVSGFFIASLTIKVLYTIFAEQDIIIVSYIPLAFMFVVYFLNAILIGRVREYQLEQEHSIRIPFFHIEPLIFLILISLVTVGMLFLPIIRINVASMSYEDEISMTGIDLLKDFATLDQGYQMLAFVLHVMLLVIGFGLVVAIAAYLSKSSLFHQVIKTATFTNVFFVFLVAISGYYFRIAKEINLEMLNNLIDHYGAGFLIDPELYDYEIETDTMIALGASVAVLLIMFARRVFDREELPALEGGMMSFGGTAAGLADRSGLGSSTSNDAFDPCYSLTEIDLMKDHYEEDLARRNELAATEVSLSGLTKFIVEYARNSRLHLSYTRSDIASFIAGLGASKLSILQGMSGTGKTSLPKIFSEAILANCEIVEVESSWKDKHELLGYYNEFSLKYTPKKFTISLYKATLNQDIVTFILLDEMNLSRIEYYFSDFLSLMEHEEEHRKIKLINLKLTRQEDGEEVEYLALERGHTLKVPPNVWFIGTANRDESTFVISDKVYDRATTMNFMKRAPKVRNFGDPIPKQFYDYNTFNNLLKEARANGNFDAEQSDVIKGVERIVAPYNISFGNRILKQIEDFVNVYKECFAGEDVEHEAVEAIMLSKVVAKLELKTIEDKEQLLMDFEKLNLPKCADFIKSLDDE